jgi:hypothetical protein
MSRGFGTPLLVLGVLIASCTIVTKLLPPNGVPDAHFGSAVAIAGGIRVVGAPDDDGLAADAGAVYVYSAANVGAPVRLVADDGAAFDDFGYAVALDGDVLAIGAPGNDAAGFLAGAVYVFRFDGHDWVEEAKLTVSPPWMGFGLSVAVDGERIAVTAPNFYDGEVRKTGAGFFFRYDAGAWNPEGLVRTNDQTTAGDFFGQDVALAGTTAAVGAAGFTRVYEFNGSFWAHGATVAGGGALALDGDRLVVGVPADDAHGTDAGAAFVYRRSGDTWTREATLRWPLPSPGYRFGTAVALSGDVLVSGVPLAPDRRDVAQAGAAILFRFDGAQWLADIPLHAGDAAAGDILGSAVALDGNTVLAGAPAHDAVGPNAGAAYTFAVPPPARLRLAARPHTIQGFHHTDLFWEGTTAAGLDVYRDGALVTTAAGGAYRDATGRRGDASYRYQVCEQGTDVCSATVDAVFVDPE